MKRSNLKSLPKLGLLAVLSLATASAQASVQDVKKAYDSGQYFSAARLAFNDANHAQSNADRAFAYSWVFFALTRAKAC